MDANDHVIGSMYMGTRDQNVARAKRIVELINAYGWGDVDA